MLSSPPRLSPHYGAVKPTPKRDLPVRSFAKPVDHHNWQPNGMPSYYSLWFARILTKPRTVTTTVPNPIRSQQLLRPLACLAYAGPRLAQFIQLPRTRRILPIMRPHIGLSDRFYLRFSSRGNRSVDTGPRI